MSSDVRVRFAPSPTGYLHVGGVRTALFNWLYARHTGGKFILRLEDTDAARNTAEAERVIYDGLRWLGLDWDEGPDAGGAHGPYRQSERGYLYERQLARLREAGRVYEDNGAIRFRFDRKPVVVDDQVCGRITIDMSDPSTNPDMTIRRPDGGWIFHFVNVVDDIDMRMTHVIRGEDHLSNTPKHLQLYEAFGAEPPQFAHIPLILNPNGSKMSKRDAGASVSTYQEEGYLPAAVLNFLCLLGWSPKENREKIPLAEIIARFDLANINRKGAVFDAQKLAWLQGEYLRELSPEQFHDGALAAFAADGIDLAGFSPEYVAAAVRTCIGKVRFFSELPGYAGFYFRDSIVPDPEAAAKLLVPANRAGLEAVRAAFAVAEPFDAAAIEIALKETAVRLGVKAGALVHPARLSLTGATSGPSLYHLIEVLGRERTLARIDAGLARIG
jgi:glutamyl-tRNA synthetase